MDDRIPDAELASRLRHGDREALGALFDRHRDFVFRVALGLTGRREDAVEVVQEVFLGLLRRPPRLGQHRARLTTWLFRVTCNRATDILRRRAREDGSPASMTHNGSEEPESILLRSERIERLAGALGRLPRRPREVFLLRVVLGLATTETARKLGCRRGAVRTALHTAVKSLRRALGEPTARSRDANAPPGRRIVEPEPEYGGRR